MVLVRSGFSLAILRAGPVAPFQGLIGYFPMDPGLRWNASRSALTPGCRVARRWRAGGGRNCRLGLARSVEAVARSVDAVARSVGVVARFFEWMARAVEPMAFFAELKARYVG